jgi:multidrug efflux pump subunit AcrA (membrane-fusion protein)
MQVPLQAGGLIKVGNRLGFQSVIGDVRKGEVVISKISPTVNQESLSVRVLGTLENKDGEWMPGTPVQVAIIDSTAPQVTAVATASIVQIEGEPHVFRVTGSGGFEPVRIVIGQQSQDFTEVKEGVAKGAMVVVKGASLLLAAWEEGASN